MKLVWYRALQVTISDGKNFLKWGAQSREARNNFLKTPLFNGALPADRDDLGAPWEAYIIGPSQYFGN